MVDYVSAYTGAQIDAAVAKTEVQKHGWQNFQDTATAITPIPITNADQWYDLTNNGLGALTDFTNYKISDHGTIFNTSTNQIDFTFLDLGDIVRVRFDVTFTTSGPNHSVRCRIVFGPSFQFTLNFHRAAFKTAVTGEDGQVLRSFPFYMLNTATRDNPAKFQVMSDSTGDSVVVNGWVLETVRIG